MRVVLWASLAAFLLDQISKYVVVHSLRVETRGPIDVMAPLLRFIYGENHGINFGIGGDLVNAWVWIGLALAICVWLLWWLWTRALPVLPRLCGGLVIGGALGNVFDRIVYGYVLDFLNMSCCGINNPYVFNVADIFIFAGALGLVLLTPEDTPRKGKKGA